jgi:hypothetical protein
MHIEVCDLCMDGNNYIRGQCLECGSTICEACTADGYDRTCQDCADDLAFEDDDEDEDDE